MNGGRGIVAALLIAGAGAWVQAARAPQPVQKAPLDALPFRVASWTGRDAAALDADTLRVLAADAYLNRSYRRSDERTPVDLYLAYYARQAPGISIHSPLHCLPGTGWETLDVATLDLALPEGGVGQVRRLMVRKDMQRALVFYWYAIHGRTIASELLSKVWLLHDSLLDRRSDAALVRIVVPMRGDDGGSAQREGLEFAHAILPFVRQLWS